MSLQPMDIYELYDMHDSRVLTVLLVQALDKFLNCIRKWMLSAQASLGLEAEKDHINCIAWQLLNSPLHWLRNKMKPIAAFATVWVQ